jgi:hypothetical protein
MTRNVVIGVSVALLLAAATLLWGMSESAETSTHRVSADNRRVDAEVDRLQRELNRLRRETAERERSEVALRDAMHDFQSAARDLSYAGDLEFGTDADALVARVNEIASAGDGATRAQGELPPLLNEVDADVRATEDLVRELKARLRALGGTER